LAARKILRVAIRKAKDGCWREIYESVEADPWGMPYRIVMKKLGSSAAVTPQWARSWLPPLSARPSNRLGPRPSSLGSKFVDAFDMETDSLAYERSVPMFEPTELHKACGRLSAGKASGPSSVPNEALKQLARLRSQTVLRVYNNCLRALHFPRQWKQAKLVLIHKGAGNSVDSPSSFRPICMLNTPGKLLERLLLQRLEAHLDDNGGRRRAPNQYGFRRGVSTETAVERVLAIASNAATRTGTKDLCVLVTLDVRNTFNSLRWPVIDSALRRKNTPEYLVEMIRS